MQSIATVWDTAQIWARWLRLGMARRKQRNTDSSSRRLALFAWALPPASNGGVYRPLSFIQYGSALGWSIDAFHGEVPVEQSQHGQDLLKQVPSDVRMHAVPSSRNHGSYKLTPQIDGGFSNALNTAEIAIERLSANPPSVVLASGPPFYSFVSAAFVARHFSVPLVLDYRDEWSECPFDFVDKHRSNREWESTCLKEAAAVFFTTQSHLEHQLSRFPVLESSRCHLIPNGWEASDFAALERADVRSEMVTNKITLAHVGTLAGHTPITPFLRAMDALLSTNTAHYASVRLKLVGRRTPEVDRAVKAFPRKDTLELIDHLPKREANKLMTSADVLVLIASRDLERYLPGKLFDYLAARRPILVFGAEGEASRLVEKLGMGYRVDDDVSPEEFASTLHKLSQLQVQQSEETLGHWLEAHRRDVLARRAFGVLDSVLQQHKLHDTQR
jgi:hypothetical protein